MNPEQKEVNNVRLTFIVICFIIGLFLGMSLASCSTSKGYNYKKHNSKNMKFKKNNENGDYMKCRRHS